MHSMIRIHAYVDLVYSMINQKFMYLDIFSKKNKHLWMKLENLTKKYVYLENIEILQFFVENKSI